MASTRSQDNAERGKQVLIVGGGSGMGAWAARSWFGRLRDVCRITLADVADEIPSARVAGELARLEIGLDAVRITYGSPGVELAEWRPIRTRAEAPQTAPRLGDFDLVVLGVPAEAIEEVSASLAPALAAGTWLIDIVSVKTASVASMLKHAPEGVLVAGTHPLFGTAAPDLLGRPVVLVPTERDDGSLTDWLEAGLEGLGAHAVRADAADHDRYMLLAQTLTHFTYLAFGRALTRAMTDGLTLGESLRLATPPYQALTGFTSRIIAQNPRLYAQIQGSDGAEWVRGLLVEAVSELADSFRGRSLEEIEGTIREIADDYSGEDVARGFAGSQAFFAGVGELPGLLRQRMERRQLTVIEVGSPIRPPEVPRQHAGVVAALNWDAVVLRGAVLRAGDTVTAVYDEESETGAGKLGLSGTPRDVEIPLYRVLRVLSESETQEWRASCLTLHERQLSVMTGQDLDADLALSGLLRLCSRLRGATLEPVGGAGWLGRYGLRQMSLRLSIYGDRDPARAVAEAESWLRVLGFRLPEGGAQ